MSVSKLTAALPLLGGLTPQQFMAKHWQKKPLVVRQINGDEAGKVPFKSPVSVAEVHALALEEDVESRLVTASKAWELKQGPFKALPSMKKTHWTLLVQGVDMHLPSVRALMDRFRFIPDARLDDAMVSYATDGGGVGAHVDSYDVFLIQIHGQRRWRISKQRDLALREDVPLKILKHFEPTQEFVLNPGDMLYLPPQWAHEGVALGECMTCSIGFRAPKTGELLRELLLRMADELEDDLNSEALYADPAQAAVSSPARMPTQLQQFATELIAKKVHALLGDGQFVHLNLGEYLSEPKATVWFEGGAKKLSKTAGVRLSAKSRMLYDDRAIYLNGESWQAAGADAKLMRGLADARALSAAQLQTASADAKALITDWLQEGWLELDRSKA
jgi:50S ribosomal protein L16 3-hydroxylase